MAVKKMKTYEHLIKLPTFEDRFDYLKLDGKIGEDTFGFDRYVNQRFYKSVEWKNIRNYIIVRDMGCDLAIENREIQGRVLIHHMNPISVTDITNRTDILLNPNYLICVSKRTHNAIHYSDKSILFTGFIERKPGDTCPWK